MADTYRVLTNDIVEINVTTSQNNNFCSIRRFDKGITIANFKQKLEVVTGGNCASMSLQLFSKDDKLIGDIKNNDALLGSFPIDNGMRIHVTDDFSFEDTNCKKFMLTMEEYDKRPDTLRNFLRTNKLGKYNEEVIKRRKERKLAEQTRLIEHTNNIQIGNRCCVRTVEQIPRKGVVMFKGEIAKHNGTFVGVKYDEPMGKNDGTYEGVKYFNCDPKYGGFVRPISVEIGEFPEDELNFDDEI